MATIPFELILCTVLRTPISMLLPTEVPQQATHLGTLPFLTLSKNLVGKIQSCTE